ISENDNLLTSGLFKWIGYASISAGGHFLKKYASSENINKIFNFIPIKSLSTSLGAAISAHMFLTGATTVAAIAAVVAGAYYYNSENNVPVCNKCGHALSQHLITRERIVVRKKTVKLVNEHDTRSKQQLGDDIADVIENEIQKTKANIRTVL
ncbi:hypothetical protein RFI_04111, partial [Reticulomyxa filosa]